MMFDKSRVYTALNADELAIGSKCIFADTIQDLRKRVQDEDAEPWMGILTYLYGDNSVKRFVGDDYPYIYAYLIEPPTESKYRPFRSTAVAMEAILAHDGWIKHKESESYSFIIACNEEVVCINNKSMDMYELFANFVFTDNGVPCGELVEER